MNANEIRETLRAEADRLQGTSPVAANALADFANNATDDELFGFRNLIVEFSDDDGADEVDRLIAEGERAVDEAFYHDR